jgi:CheY-like chemotaxis protein
MHPKQDLLREVSDLRRFAQSLFGSQLQADKEVDTIVKGLTDENNLRDGSVSPRVALFRALVRSHKRKHREDGFLDWMLEKQSRELDADEMVLSEGSRLAFLLSYQERFAPKDVMEILEIEELELEHLLVEGQKEISQKRSTGVLIIEDEMFIAMHLQNLVKDMGHWVLDVARTRDEVCKVVSDMEHFYLRPGLILSDVQLADGSSGIDAVNDHAVRERIPVVFITANPEKLHDSPIVEQEHILRKPFSDSALKATISQALYFR